MSNPNEVFWLASYTHNTLAPLFTELKAIEPSLLTSIEMSFADANSVHHQKSRITVSAWWKRDGMFLLSNGLENKADIDKLADQVRAQLDKLKLEARQAKKRELYRAAYSNTGLTRGDAPAFA